jgi:hypothetical protein
VVASNGEYYIIQLCHGTEGCNNNNNKRYCVSGDANKNSQQKGWRRSNLDHKHRIGNPEYDS